MRCLLCVCVEDRRFLLPAQGSKSHNLGCLCATDSKTKPLKTLTTFQYLLAKSLAMFQASDQRHQGQFMSKRNNKSIKTFCRDITNDDLTSLSVCVLERIMQYVCVRECLRDCLLVWTWLESGGIILT